MAWSSCPGLRPSVIPLIRGGNAGNRSKNRHKSKGIEDVDGLKVARRTPCLRDLCQLQSTTEERLAIREERLGQSIPVACQKNTLSLPVLAISPQISDASPTPRLLFWGTREGFVLKCRTRPEGVV
jgi:hypothetical protein